jgi:hypothetical protein
MHQAMHTTGAQHADTTPRTLRSENYSSRLESVSSRPAAALCPSGPVTLHFLRYSTVLAALYGLCDKDTTDWTSRARASAAAPAHTTRQYIKITAQIRDPQ